MSQRISNKINRQLGGEKIAYYTISVNGMPTFVLHAENEDELKAFKRCCSNMGVNTHRVASPSERAELLVLKIEAINRGEDPDLVAGAPLRKV